MLRDTDDGAMGSSARPFATECRRRRTSHGDWCRTANLPSRLVQDCQPSEQVQDCQLFFFFFLPGPSRASTKFKQNFNYICSVISESGSPPPLSLPPAPLLSICTSARGDRAALVLVPGLSAAPNTQNPSRHIRRHFTRLQ